MPMIPFVKNGYYGNRNWIPLVNGNGLTAGGGEPDPEYETVTGNPVSFSTAKAAPLKQLSVAFSPVQNLNGYENPWPAGGGKNKLPFTTKSETIAGVTFTIQSDGEVLINRLSGSNSAFFVYNKITLPAGSYKLYSNADNTLFRVYVYDGTSGYNVGQEFTSDGQTLLTIYLQAFANTSFSNQLVTMMICDSSVADASFAPYSNICPISGWNSLTVEQTGVNVWDEEWEVGGIDSSTGRDGTDPNSWRTVNYVPIKPNTEYYVASSATNKSIRARFYAADKSYIGYAPKSGSTDTGHAFVSPENAYYLRFNPAITGVPNHDISINYPATDTAYHAYNPASQTISINIGQTVYSGTVDVLTGVVTVDKVGFDGGSVTWSKTSSSAYFNFSYMPDDVPMYKVNTPTVISSAYKSECNNSASASDDNYVWIRSTTNKTVCVKDTSKASMTKEQFKEAMTGVTFVYELTTPQTIQLTPQEVSSLLGVNVLFSDANGDLTVEYRSN